jgi:hypothetical protein
VQKAGLFVGSGYRGRSHSRPTKPKHSVRDFVITHSPLHIVARGGPVFGKQEVASGGCQLPLDDDARQVPRDIAWAGEEVVIAVDRRFEFQDPDFIPQTPIVRCHAIVADRGALYR